MTIYVPGKLIFRKNYIGTAMSWVITGKQKNKGLLDAYPGAAAAYSLRDLSLLRNAPVVRVRRDNDDAEDDFTATDVSDGTLAAWVGAGNNGFVRTWYDQSGNANDAQQVIAGAQPKVVDNGFLLTENAKVALDFDGVDDKLIASFSLLPQPNTVFSLASLDNEGSTYLVYDSNDGNNRNSYDSSGIAYAGFLLRGSAWTASIQYLHSILYNAAGSVVYRNSNVNVAGSVGTQGLSGLTIGARFSGSFWQGKIQELIVYPSDQSSNRVAIEADINAHYSIYP